MPIIDPLRNPAYESGGLIQQCENCEWAQGGHLIEIVECPLCGEKLKPPLALTFGGLTVVFDGKGFAFHDNTGQAVLVQRADAPEVIQFLCRHAEDLRTGETIYDGGKPRRIAKGKDFTDMLRK